MDNIIRTARQEESASEVTQEEVRLRYPKAEWYEDGFEVSKARHLGNAGEVKTVIQKKPWGFEVWLVYTGSYALKILIVNPGHRLSLQKHAKKQETWMVLRGSPEIVLGDQVMRPKAGEIIHVPAGTVHRITATDKPIEILEVSSPELWDVIRIQDDFKRS